jgi:hypothetical protein
MVRAGVAESTVVDAMVGEGEMGKKQSAEGHTEACLHFLWKAIEHILTNGTHIATASLLHSQFEQRATLTAIWPSCCSKAHAA